MSWSDHVHPHGPLEEVLPGLWQVRGSLPRFPITRNMHLWRDAEGDLVIHSGVAVEEATLDAILALGSPRVLIVPNRFHRSDAPVFKERFPDLMVVAPRAVREAAEEVLPVEALAEDCLPERGTTCLVPAGLKPGELIYRVPLADEGHALVTADALFNHEHAGGFGGFMMRYITRSTGFFGITGLGRWLALSDGATFAGWLRAQAEDPGLRAIAVGHGDPITESPAARLREAADRI